MENVSFNEEIFGYGYEDIDFDHRVRLSGHDIGQTDFVIIHNYHSHEERKIDPVRFQKNKYIVEYTSKLIENHQIIFKYKNIDYVKVINPFWESDLILMWDTKRLMHRDNGNFGDYELDGDVLHVKWDNFSPERYRKSGDAFEFIEES